MFLLALVVAFKVSDVCVCVGPESSGAHGWSFEELLYLSPFALSGLVVLFQLVESGEWLHCYSAFGFEKEGPKRCLAIAAHSLVCCCLPVLGSQQ